MSVSDASQEFERRLHELLARQADAVGGHVRSRLTQARHAALSHAGEHQGAWREVLAGRRLWMPAAGAVTVVAVGVLLFASHRVARAPFAAGVTPVTAPDVQLLADHDGLAMLEGGGGQFYEWAAAQARGPAAHGAAADGPNENGG